MKKLLIHGVATGLLSGIAGIIYLNIYQEALGVNYGQIINMSAILAASLMACILMTLGYAALHTFEKEKLRGWFNLLIAILSFASIIGPIGMSLPLDIEYPELFPGLVVPMHFFPIVAFLTLYPFFSTTH